MKINHIVESTVAGAVAPVAMPMGKTRKRVKEFANVPGLEPVAKVMKNRKAKRMGPYMNSPVLEGRMKDIAYDLEHMRDTEFTKKYGKTKQQIRSSLKENTNETMSRVLSSTQKELVKKYKKSNDPSDLKTAIKAGVTPKELMGDSDKPKLDEDDIIVVPGLKRKSSELMPKDANEMERIEMALGDLKQSVKSSKVIYDILKSRGDEIEGWVQEKLAKAEDYLNTVREYLEGKVALEAKFAQQEPTSGGAIAGVIAAESVNEASMSLYGPNGFMNRYIEYFREYTNYGQDPLKVKLALGAIYSALKNDWNLTDTEAKRLALEIEDKGSKEIAAEVITKKTPAGEIISDFQKSKNKKFKGKSKEKRKEMALGAYYSMHPEKSKKK